MWNCIVKSVIRKIRMVMMVIVLTFLVPLKAFGEEGEKVDEPSQLYALSACLMDADSGRILFAKNGAEKRANASTTKILTLIVTLENANLDELVTVSEYAAKQPDVQLNMNSGESYKLEDLCYSLMLESHNDSAVAIAEHVGGTVENFAEMMNEKARACGCQNSNFVTPNGLDSKNEKGIHQTTTEDLARILRYCIMISDKREDFLKITQTATYTFSNKEVDENGESRDGGRIFSCNNHNAFLKMMDGALTGKTGFTGDAGYCYVGALKRDDRTYIVALLGCGWPNNKSYKWSDTRTLMEYGIANYMSHRLSEVKIDTKSLNPLMVEDGQTDEIGGQAYTKLKIEKQPDMKILLKTGEAIQVKCDMKKKLTAPVNRGDVVGKVSYQLNGETIQVENIVAVQEVAKINVRWSFLCIMRQFLF